jgi:phospholipid/cholesterol/gamma-HCH transport system substrate-binding protein
MNRLERLYSPPEIGAPGKREGRARRRDLFLSGVFVIAMAAVTVAALTLAIPGLFRPHYRLYAYFPEAKGLDEGIEVVQDGYAVGLVERVTPIFPDRDPDAAHCPPPPAEGPVRSPTLPCFRATLRIRGQWPVPVDSRAQLGTAGLLSGDAVKLRPGASATLLADGATVPSLGREGDLMDQLSALADSLDRVVNETVAPALASIKSQIQTIESLLGTGGDEGENRERLAGAFENLRKLSGDLERAVDPDKIAAILDSAKTMSEHLAQVSADLNSRSGEVQQTVRRYGDLAKEIQGLVAESRPGVQRSLDDTQLLLQEVTAALTPILANVEDATHNLSALSRDLRQNPAMVIRGRKVEDSTPWFK